MKKYSITNILRLAKRHNNNKRSYIIVNPLQGKHMPVSPHIALEMMNSLGKKVANFCEGKANLVIGFAETATAIGAVVAKSLNNNSIYIQTTRERYSQERKWIIFQEEHSHAVEQRLLADNLDRWIRNTEYIIFVDDELSTGKTVYNIVNQIKNFFPETNKKKIIVASIINRLTKENEKKLLDIGVYCISLLKSPQVDYNDFLVKIDTKKAEEVKVFNVFKDYKHFFSHVEMNPRFGVFINDYINVWKQEFEYNIKYDMWSKNCQILVLGTEECMLPGLILGNILEEKGFKNVFFQATTRSPISISKDNDYPIKSGWQIKSFYDDERRNYIYNMRAYDIVLIVSDTNYSEYEAMNTLGNVLVKNGCKKIFFLGGHVNV